MKLKQCRYVIIKSRGFSSTAKLQQLLSAGVYIVIDRWWRLISCRSWSPASVLAVPSTRPSLSLTVCWPSEHWRPSDTSTLWSASQLIISHNCGLAEIS